MNIPPDDKRKLIAAEMDVVFVKPHRTAMFGHVCEQFIITKIKRCLVYDPNKVRPLQPTCRKIK